MKNLNQIIVFLIIITVLMVGGCHCKDKNKPCTDPSNPECENYDPCYGKKAPSADFIIGQSSTSSIYFGMKPREFVTDDTIFTINNESITFLAKEADAEYEWELGSETITEKRFTRGFSNAGFGRYYAKLTIRKEVDNSCFPEYTGTATQKRYFEIRPLHEFPIMGKYRVLFEGEKDSSNVEIRPWKLRRLDPWSPWRIDDEFTERELSLIGFANGIVPRADTIGSGVLDGGSLVSGSKIYALMLSRGDSTGTILLEGNNIIHGNYNFYYFDPRFSDSTYNQWMKFSGTRIE